MKTIPLESISITSNGQAAKQSGSVQWRHTWGENA